MLKRIISYTICLTMLMSSCLMDMQAYATTIGQDVYYSLPIDLAMDEESDANYIDNQLGATGQAELSQDRVYGDYSVKVTLESNSGDTDYTLVDSDAFTINNYSQVEIWVKPGEGSEWIEFSTATSSSKKYEVGEEIERGTWNCINLDFTEIQGSLTQGEDLKVESNDSSTWYFDEVRSIETKVYSFNMSNMINTDTEISNGGLQFKDNSSSTFDIEPTILKSEELAVSGEKEISKIAIDREYADTSGDLAGLPTDALYLSDLTSFPTNFVISDNGEIMYYEDPSDDEKIYKLNLLTGEKTLITMPYYVTEMKTNNTGEHLAVYTDYAERIYYYEESSPSVELVDSNIYNQAFDINNDGDLYYIEDSEDDIYVYDGSSKTSLGSKPLSAGSFQVSNEGEALYYLRSGEVYEFVNTPDLGWRENEIVSHIGEEYFDSFLLNREENRFYVEIDGEWYIYNLDEESIRTISTGKAETILGISDDDRLMAMDERDNYYLYNPDTETKEEVNTDDIKYNPNTYAVFSQNGKKLAYLAADSSGNSNGIRVKYIGQVEDPESYLLSFDGKQSWYSFHEGAWTKVSDSATPSEEDFFNYGITADEVNSLDKGDYGKLYEEFENIYSVSISSYFASLDCFTTPSIKSIKVTACNDVDDYDRYKTKSNLYTAKKKDFDGSDWRKISKVYPLEIAQQSAEFIYFIKKGTDYRVYKDGSFTTVSSAASYLSDVETNWIDICLEGMTAEELRSIPEEDLTTELAGNTFSLVYALKVCDKSTEDYSSMVTIDYTEDLFTYTGMTLSVTLYGNTTPVQYTNLTDAQVEDFMEWIYLRQYNYGPVFYRIDNGTTSEFINYYMVQKVSITD